MHSLREELRAAGIWRGNDERAEPLVECARLTRRTRDEHVRALGLMPAADDVAIPAIALELGRSLAHGSGTPVAVVDVHGSWPGARGLVAASPSPDHFATCWLTESLALITLRGVESGTRLVRLRDLVVDRAEGFEHLIVDLTGLDRRGEQLDAIDLMDAVVVVARSGRTTTREIRRRLDEIPEARSLGVLLTGL